MEGFLATTGQLSSVIECLQTEYQHTECQQTDYWMAEWETDQMWADQMSIDVKLMQRTTLQQSRSLEKFLALASNRMLFQLQGL